MDANGHRFWLIADAAQLALGPGTAWDAGCRCLVLAGQADAMATPATRSAALAMGDAAATAVDGFGGHARVAADGRTLLAGGAATGETPLATLPEGTQIRDLCFDGAGTLRLAGRIGAGPDGLHLIDLRGRWTTPIALPTPGAAPDRVATGGGIVWVLERATGRLWTQLGTPLPDLARRAPADHIFRPRPEHGDAPRLADLPPLALAPGERIACMAAAPDGRLAVLVLDIPQRPGARVILVAAPGAAPTSLPVPQRGFAGQIGWVAADRLALLYPDTPRALVFGVAATLTPGADRHPLRGAGPIRLARGDALPCAYVRERAAPRPLHAISRPGYGADGTARAVIDTGTPGLIWHRLVVEGDFPPGTGATITLAAGDDPDALGDPAPHLVGDAPDPGAPSPRAAWLVEPSELPFHPGLLGVPPIPGRRGAFSVLVQRPGTRSRELAGRHLAVRITLHGNGQTSPRLAAIRAWGGRFSLSRAYLPPIFHGPQGDATPGPADPRDWAERHVAMFEDVLTRLEDKVAAAPLLTDPQAAPEAALEWLAGWIGLGFLPGLDVARRRAMLANGIRLHRRRGTVGGLMLALDLATAGEVGRGGIVAVEDHRLARVFATILGARLGADFDPLLAGPVDSGNSVVGPTLFLADAQGPGGRLAPAQAAELAALVRGAGGGAPGAGSSTTAPLAGPNTSGGRSNPTGPGPGPSGPGPGGGQTATGPGGGQTATGPGGGQTATGAGGGQNVTGPGGGQNGPGPGGGQNGPDPGGAPGDAAVRGVFAALAHRVTLLVHAEMAPADAALAEAVARQMTPAHVALRVERASRPLIVGLSSLLGIATYLRPRPAPGPVVLDTSLLGGQDLLLGAPGLDPRRAARSPS